MFEHIGIVVPDLDRSVRLHSATLEPLDLKILVEHRDGPNEGRVIFSSDKPQSPFFVLGADRPTFWRTDSEAAKSPVHLCFMAPSNEAVDRFHAAGLEQGAKDNGAPGIRRPPSTTHPCWMRTPTISKRGVYLQSPNG